MNITQESELQKQYWGIKEVAEILAIEQSCVRFWCEEFKVQVKRTRGHHRKFQMKDITRLQVIKYLLQEENFTVDGAKAKLKLIKLPVSASNWKEEVRKQLR